MFAIQKVTPADLDTLLTLSRDTFFHFFAPLNEPANMEAYAAKAFTPGRILAELTNPESEFYFALYDGEIAGYLKLNFGNAQTEFRDKNALEVERIYVLGEYHGKHIGSKLLNFAMQTGKSRQLQYIWLGVWEHNHKAIGFYEHYGFSIFSSHEFVLGDDQQTDLLMKKII
ncbi:GNAT family N-acetyltransferase [soil metagenome]|jgi:ribosomal protein S18 acetylase RimI-like enzyme